MDRTIIAIVLAFACVCAWQTIKNRSEAAVALETARASIEMSRQETERLLAIIDAVKKIKRESAPEAGPGVDRHKE